MPGRKNDIKDAQWIATLLHKGLIRGSFIPPPVIQELKIYSRKHGWTYRPRLSCESGLWEQEEQAE